MLPELTLDFDALTAHLEDATEGRLWKWTTNGEVGGSRCHYLETEGATIRLSVDQTGKRVIAAGSYPLTGLRYSYHEATVAVSRGEAAIAKDIARRVYPGVKAETEAVVAYNAAVEADIAVTDGHARRIADKLGVAIRPTEDRRWHRPDRRPRVVSTPGYLGDFTVSAYKGGTVRIDLTGVPVDLAERIAEVIGDYQKEATTDA